MKNIYLLVIICICTLESIAQKNSSIKGIAFDILTKQPVVSATITLLQKKDSSLVSFTMTDAKGHFELTNLNHGDYRLLITHINYHNVSRGLTVNGSVDLGNLP